jgi:hypothetical protein
MMEEEWSWDERETSSTKDATKGEALCNNPQRGIIMSEKTQNTIELVFSGLVDAGKKNLRK